MVDFLESGASGLGSESRDPVMAAINGESADGERSPLDFSAESSDVSEKIVPMSGPEPLELDKPIGEDEFVRQARRKGTDPIIGSDGSAIQTRRGSDRAGNNRRRAYDIGTLDGNESYSDSVSRRDRKDFYEFRVDSRGRVEIDLSGMSDNADLFLHNSRGKVIKKSRRSGSASESISRVLNPGDYYVQVRSRSRWDSTDYDLGLNFSELTPDNAGNNRRKARNLGSLSGTESYNDFVGRGDRNDFYTFTLDGEKGVGISLSGLSGNADLHLFKKGTRGVVGRSTNSGSTGESINESLGAGTYYLRVKSKGGSGSDYSLSLEAEEKVAPPPPPPPPPNYYVNVTSPNGGETWEAGNIINIAWDDNISENVKIDLYKGGSLSSTISSSTESDGSYSWTIPAGLAEGSDYNIKVASTSDGNVYDDGDGNFTVKVEPPPSYYINVTSPNGSETWEAGNTVNVAWDDNISENVKIDLYKGGFLSSTISSSTESDGSYSWTIPTDLAEGSDYNIKVTSTSDGNVYDDGDGNFTVKVEPPPSYYIDVTSPNGSETWEAGNIINIGWNDNISENVKIDLYKGGSLSSTISSSTESDGSYSWTIPAGLAEGSDYNIKVTSTSDGNVYDDGDGNFTIQPEVIIETVDERKEWRGWVSKWDPSSGAISPVNVNENKSFELVGQLNLGSNIREIATDGRHGINNADWGAGSVKGYSQLPTDNFLVKAYTEVDLEGGRTYDFEAKGDDGYQIWLKNLDTNEWRWVTPENEWETTVGQTDTDKFTHTIPGDKGGRYYVGFFHYEDGGDAYFGLNWKEVDLGDNSIELNPGSKGIDVANHQGNVNWQEVKNDGYSFAFVKATEGTTFLDPYFHDNWEEMKDVGISRGAYHYFHPNIDPVQQANYFLNTIGTLEPNDLPPVLDVEVSNGLDANSIVNSVRQWLDVVEEGTGHQPIIYTGPYFWESSVGNTQEFADYPLWIAHYGAAQPRVPGGWDDWTFWQQTSSGSVDGIAGNVDLNVFSDNPTDFSSTGGNDGVTTGSNDQWEPYIVQSGDTLSDIAQRTTGDSSRYLEIANYNGIDDPNTIYAGQQIQVPGNSSTGTAVEVTTGGNDQWEPYIVQSGDTLSDIAQRTTGDGSRYLEIANYNGIDDPNTIYVGQQIQVPGNSSTGTTVEVTTGGNSETSDANNSDDSEIIESVQTFNAGIQEHNDYHPDGVSLYRYDDSSAEIDPNRETTLVIHGWNSNPEAENIRAVLNAATSLGHQVLALDWRNPAAKSSGDNVAPWSTVGAIAPVAKKAAEWLLDTIEIEPNKLTIVGHSLGAYVGAEIGKEFQDKNKQVKKLVGLDPANLATNYDIDATQPWHQFVTEFNRAAGESLALVVQDSEGIIPSLLEGGLLGGASAAFKHAWNGDLAGSNDRAKTAHKSFVVDFTGGSPFSNNEDYHGAVAKVYADLLKDRKQIPSDLQKDWYGNDGHLLWWTDTRDAHEGVIYASVSGEINSLKYVNDRSWSGNAQENTDWA